MLRCLASLALGQLLLPAGSIHASGALTPGAGACAPGVPADGTCEALDKDGVGLKEPPAFALLQHALEKVARHSPLEASTADPAAPAPARAQAAASAGTPVSAAAEVAGSSPPVEPTGPAPSDGVPVAGTAGEAEMLLSRRADEQEDGAGSDDQPIMENVIQAVMDLDRDAHLVGANEGGIFPKGYDRGHMPYTEHFQGVQRRQGSNIVYLSGSGKSESESQLFVLKFQSKSGVGALGNNLLTKKGKRDDYPSEDALVKVIRFDSEYYHAGGLTSFGRYLVVGAEKGCDASKRLLGMCSDASRVYFFDTTTPRNPVELPYHIDRPEWSAGASALTQEPDGTFLLIIGRTDSAILDFYRSKTTSLASDPEWEHVSTWEKEALLVNAGEEEDFNSYQNLNFVRQADGKLFLFGMFRSINGLGDDKLDVFTVESPASDEFTITKIGSKHLSCDAAKCNFQAGAGVYVESPTQLIVYGTNWEPYRDEILVSEFRSKKEGIGGQGLRDTGGTCSWMFDCDESRGPTMCWDGKCVCKRNYKTVDGKCVSL